MASFRCAPFAHQFSEASSKQVATHWAEDCSVGQPLQLQEQTSGPEMERLMPDVCICSAGCCFWNLEETRKNIQIQSPQTKNVLRPWWQEYKETTQAWISLNTAITAWFLCMQSLSQGEGIKATWGQVGTRVSQIQGCSLAISMSNPLQFQWTQNLFLYTTWQLNGDKVSQSFQRARDNKVSLELWWLAALQSSQPWAVPASEIPDLYWQSLGVLKSWIECRHQPYNNGIRTCQRDFTEALYCLAGCLLHTIIHSLAGFVSAKNLQPRAHTKLWQASSETADKIRWANTGTLHSALAVALGNILSHVYQDAVSRIEST